MYSPLLFSSHFHIYFPVSESLEHFELKTEKGHISDLSSDTAWGKMLTFFLLNFSDLQTVEVRERKKRAWVTTVKSHNSEPQLSWKRRKWRELTSCCLNLSEDRRWEWWIKCSFQDLRWESSEQPLEDSDQKLTTDN